MSEEAVKVIAPAPATETPAPAAEPAAKVEAQQPNPVDDFSTKFAALSRREKQAQEREAKLKADAEKYNKYIDLETAVKENPLKVLEAYGLDLDTVIAASLGHAKPSPTVEDQIAQLKADIQREKDEARKAEEDRKKAEEEAYQSSIEEAIRSHQNLISEHLSKNAEKYELIHLQEAQDLVWETTEAYYEEHGEVLTPEKAADLVENYLYDQALKVTQTSKFKPKVQEEVKTESKPAFKETKVNPAIKDTPRTLSQDLSSIPPEKTNERLSREESKRRAAEFLSAQWKKN